MAQAAAQRPDTFNLPTEKPPICSLYDPEGLGAISEPVRGWDVIAQEDG